MTEPRDHSAPEPANQPATQPRDTSSQLGRREQLALRAAGMLTLIGLALMAWSMLVPTPMPVMLAMTAGQGIGMSAFALYIYVVVRVLRREYRRDGLR